MTQPKILRSDVLAEPLLTDDVKQQIFGKPIQTGANIRKTSSVKPSDVIAYTRFGTQNQTGAFVKQKDPREYFETYIRQHNKVLFGVKKRDTSNYVLEDNQNEKSKEMKSYFSNLANMMVKNPAKNSSIVISQAVDSERLPEINKTLCDPESPPPRMPKKLPFCVENVTENFENRLYKNNS